MFSEAKKIFFLGIGGIGVSAIARMMMIEGREVSGSDLTANENTKDLERLGAKILIGQAADLVPKDTDLVIYTIAILNFEPALIKAIKQKKINIMSYPEVLSQISKDKYTIAISGTHGKTTTTAMIGKIMIDAGFRPTVIVGAKAKDYNSNYIAGKGKYFVVEACEYQRSFLNLSPKILVITNIDFDHMDYYRDIDDTVSAFFELAMKVPKEGTIICDQSHNLAKRVIAEAKANIVDYSSVKISFNLKFPGEHYLKNAKAAFVVSRLFEVREKDALDSLNNFSGTDRRFAFRGSTCAGALIYDDYAHHPTEISATLGAARQAFPEKKITAIFQPHLYSRTKALLDDFAKALKMADNVILAPIYAAREKADPSISSSMLARKIEEENPNVLYLESFTDIAKEIKRSSGPNDVIIVMGAGDINSVSELLLKK